MALEGYQGDEGPVVWVEHQEVAGTEQGSWDHHKGVVWAEHQ